MNVSSSSILMLLAIQLARLLVGRSLYELDLMKLAPEIGFYRITVSLAASQPSDVKLLGTSGAEVWLQFSPLWELSIIFVSVCVCTKCSGAGCWSSLPCHCSNYCGLRTLQYWSLQCTLCTSVEIGSLFGCDFHTCTTLFLHIAILTAAHLSVLPSAVNRT